MRPRSILASSVALFAFAVSPGQAQEDPTGYTLDVAAPPVTVQRQGPEGQIELQVTDPGPVEMSIGENVSVGPGGVATAQVGITHFTLSEGATFRVHTVRDKRAIVVANRVRYIVRTGSRIALGGDTITVDDGMVRIYGPDKVDASPITVSFLAGGKTHSVELGGGRETLLIVVTQGGTTTVSSLRGTVPVTTDGKVQQLARGGSMTIEAAQEPVAEQPVEEQPVEEQPVDEAPETQVGARITVKTAPVTIQRGGEGGPTERVTEAKVVEVALRDIVSLGAGASAQADVGGSIVDMAEYVTFAVNKVTPTAAQVDLLGVDLELVTVTVIEAAFGSLKLTTVSGTVRCVAPPGQTVTFILTMPSGKVVPVTVTGGAGAESSGEVSISIDPVTGGLTFANVGGGGAVQVGDTPIGAGVAIGEGGIAVPATVDTTGVAEVSIEAVDPTQQTTTQSTNEPIVGTVTVNDPNSDVDPVSFGF